ncbi:unnamed protein product [Colias eurytheme]|nr:unnamed protein product [Colias eurytheme]
MAVFQIVQNSEQNNRNDEILMYQMGRYINSNEAAWRIFSFPIHEREPAVQHLAVHLENGQRVYFTKDSARKIASEPPQNTTLTAFFQLCQTDPFARKLLLLNTLQILALLVLQIEAQCSLTPCEVLQILTRKTKPGDAGNEACAEDLKWRQLDRRLRAIEQPAWTISLSQSRWRQCSKSVCRCDASHRSLNCWRSGLTSLNADLVVPVDIYTIDLGTNKLRTLHKSSFKGMRSLTELDMFDNHVEYLPSGIFDSLINLRILRLQRNYLEEIDSEAFRYTKKLFHVDLSNNFLYTLPERLFANNTYLETVDISNNQIVYIPSDTFLGLRSLLILDLSNNKIQQIQNGTFHLINLQILKLSNNQISNITDTAFESLLSLETLLMDKNDLRIIPTNLFCNLFCLTFLDLSNNNLMSLTGLEFRHLRSLRFLNLKENLLQELPDDAFVNCSSLEKLDLSKNKLKFLNVTTFRGLENLTSLILSDNQIYEVHFKTFATFKNLTTLYLDNNMFPSLPSRTLDYMPKLANVKLSNNPWHCDCHALYISAWVRLNEMKIWDYSPTCVSPWYLEGHFLKKLKFPELCTGQWASMVNLSPRLPMQQLLALNVTVNRKPQESMEEIHDMDNWQ